MLFRSSQVQALESQLSTELATLEQSIKDQSAVKQQTLDGLKSELEQAKKMIQDNAATPALLQTMVEKLQEKVNPLEKRLGNAKGDAAAAKSETQKAMNEIKKLKEEIEKLKEEIKKLLKRR